MARSIAQTFLDTLDLRRGSVITMQEISCLQRHLTRLARQEACAPNSSHVAPRVDILADSITDHGPYQVDEVSAAVAYAWWQKAVITGRGTRRNTKLMRANEYRANAIWDVLHDGRHHVTFNGWVTTYNRHHPRQFDPEFIMHGTTGTTFAFVQRPWQRGGNVPVTW